MTESDTEREAVGLPAASRRFWGVLAVALVFGVLVWQGRQRSTDAEALRLAGPIFGTTWSLLSPNPGGLEADAVQVLIEETLAQVDACASHWREDSKLALLQRELDAWIRSDRFGPGVPVSVENSPMLLDLATLTEELVRATGGAFDPTVGALVGAWGFGPDAALDEPTASELEQALARVGWERLGFDGERFWPGSDWTEGPELDFSAIAKGLAVDAVATALEDDLGLRDYFLEVGGEVRLGGERLGGGAWRVGVEAPTAAPGDVREAWLAIEPGRGAVATSGDYRAWRASDSGRVGHVIDPRTGRPFSNGIASVTVVDRSSGGFPCARADGLATALLVMGVEEGLVLVESMSGIEALWILTNDQRDRFDTSESSGFEALVAPSR